MKAPGLVIFTDLDGTLLDHDSYEWSPATPALTQIRRHHVPLIFNSSKTAAEIDSLRTQVGNMHPYIVENGAAVIIPSGYFDNAEEHVEYFGAPREHVLNVLSECRAQGFRFRGFGDMTADELAEHSGLTPEAAALSKCRLATEPLIWKGDFDSLEAFQAVLAQNNLQLLSGGRFHHVMGDFDKADAMRWLFEQYRSRSGSSPLLSVALGDSPNDWKMLAQSDIPVVIRSTRPEPVVPGVRQPVMYSEQRGPVGWNDCVLKILARYGYEFRANDQG